LDSLFIAFLIVSALAAGVGILAFLRDRGTPGHLSFCFGFLALSAATLVAGRSLLAIDPHDALNWHSLRFFPEALIPGIWAYFSLRYARGENRPHKWSYYAAIVLAAAIPLIAVFGFEDSLMANTFRIGERYDFQIGPAGYALFLCSLLSAGFLLVNLEYTFRAAVGTYRWRIKFIILGVATVFTARVYTSSQIILFHQHLPTFDIVNAAALFISSCFILIALYRKNTFKVAVYPSQQVLQFSLTTVLIGAYLLIIGVFSKLLRGWHSTEASAFKAFLLILSLAFLALFLLSERNRDRLRRFISRHLNRPMYDYRSVWLTFTERTASVVSADALSRTLVNWLSEQLRVLSTSVWLGDPADPHTFVLAASTAFAETSKPTISAPGLSESLVASPLPFDVDRSPEPWTAALKTCFADNFKKAGNRVCVPLVASGHLAGFITLGDRVNNVALGQQEFDLLQCIGDQVASNLLNLQLSNRLLQAKEMEAFQTIAAFFIHDLKNTASTLNLTLQNLPRHFDNPEFRKDALKAISKSVSHIQELISRLTLFRQKLELSPRQVDLNKLLESTLGCLAGQVPVKTQFAALSPIRADEDQLQKVFTNLLLNAREALKDNGEIILSTSQQNGWAIATVADNGCGMSADFLTHSLFRPFKTTKKGGIGIGMFQTKTIVEAHKGRIEVDSQPGRGTTFRVFLPESTSS
jgi:putative PEP-CTERM system histidine kinase